MNHQAVVWVHLYIEHSWKNDDLSYQMWTQKKKLMFFFFRRALDFCFIIFLAIIIEMDDEATDWSEINYPFSLRASSAHPAFIDSGILTDFLQFR